MESCLFRNPFTQRDLVVIIAKSCSVRDLWALANVSRLWRSVVLQQFTKTYHREYEERKEERIRIDGLLRSEFCGFSPEQCVIYEYIPCERPISSEAMRILVQVLQKMTRPKSYGDMDVTLVTTEYKPAEFLSGKQPFCMIKFPRKGDRVDAIFRFLPRRYTRDKKDPREWSSFWYRSLLESRHCFPLALEILPDTPEVLRETLKALTKKPSALPEHFFRVYSKIFASSESEDCNFDTPDLVWAAVDFGNVHCAKYLVKESKSEPLKDMIERRARNLWGMALYSNKPCQSVYRHDPTLHVFCARVIELGDNVGAIKLAERVLTIMKTPEQE